MVNNDNFLLKEIPGENIYYVYGYYLEDDTPFYIGMGHGNRMVCHTWPSKRNERKTIFYNKLNKLINNGIPYYYKKIYEDLSIEDAIKFEMELISKFGRKDLKTGILYNLTDGGEGHKNYKRSRETIEKVRSKTTGMTRTKEFSDRISRLRTGMIFSDEHRANISKAQKGTKKPKPLSSLPNYKRTAELKKNNPEFSKKMSDSKRLLLGKRVVQICPKTNEIIKHWNNQMEAAEFIGGSSSRIILTCEGKVNKHKKYYWKYDG